MRYEIKYLFPPTYADRVLAAVMRLPCMFREIYHERRVNNIYLETPELSDYLAATNGISRRSKTRLRWYGSLWHDNAIPQLELKSKFGFVGDKRSITLPAMSFGADFAFDEYRAEIAANPKVEAIIGNRLPILVNAYTRRYFATPDALCRITIDREQKFYTLASATMGEWFHVADNRIVLEVKFDREDLQKVADAIQLLGWHINKNSKYVNGVNIIVFGRNTY
jgi:hypothetical protein